MIQPGHVLMHLVACDSQLCFVGVLTEIILGLHVLIVVFPMLPSTMHYFSCSILLLKMHFEGNYYLDRTTSVVVCPSPHVWCDLVA